jgi:hypothetical protein
MIEWLQSLSGGAASFVGSFTGAFIGLVALVIGALFNAHLNRRRDREIRLEEKHSVATALHAELAGFDQMLSRNSEALENITRDHYLIPDLAQSVRVFPHMLPKIGLLDPATINNTVDAYLMMDQYSESLLVLGGTLSQKVTHRRLIEMPSNSAKHVVMLNKKVSEAIQRALSNLDGHLHRT